MKNAISFLVGILTGALVGVVLALLFAPASGGEVRSQIKEQLHHIQAEVSHAAEQRRAELEHQLAELRLPRRAS